MPSQTIPLHIPSAANLRQNRWEKAAQNKSLRGAGFMMARIMGIKIPCAVTMTRIAPRLLDDDNLQFAFKAFRDGIADALKTHDRNPRITWHYQQEIGPRPMVRLEMTRTEHEPEKQP